MGKFNLSQVATDMRNGLVKHTPELLTGFGIAGMVTSTVLAVKATPKALRLIEHEKEVREVEELTPVETVKAAWKCYIPAAVTGVASIACLIGANRVSSKRHALLATAYKLTESAFADYREKVVETVGEKKEQAVRDRVHKERVEKNPPSQNEVIITKSGDTLCCDYESGRYFKSDIDKIHRAVNMLNKQLLVDDYVSLNDFYDLLDLEGTDLGARMGWKITDVGKSLIEINIGSCLTPDGVPCIAIDFKVPPKYGFDRFN